MTRNEKLKKLGNAIREYRGVYYSHTGKWKRPAKPEKEGNILIWLERLGIQEPMPMIADIQEFKNFDQMREWLSRLSTSQGKAL
jgi:hypothetical protein